MMQTIPELVGWFENKLADYDFEIGPASLSEPVKYIMDIGGKRLRPAFLLAAHQLYSEERDEAFEAALAIEVFHNFSLMHDDIMDGANKRRNVATTHQKFGINDAILSGDAMLIYSYKLLSGYEAYLVPLMHLFNKTAMELCRGQAMDMDFERSENVGIEDYIEMIGLKTSVLLGAAMGIGGMIGGAPKEDVDALYEFGRNVGIAFQIQDDLLDTFGDENQTGKKRGGDILRKKKTYLYLKSLELLSGEESIRLKAFYTYSDVTDETELINEVTRLFRNAHVEVHARELKLVYQQLALSHLAVLENKGKNMAQLKDFANVLLDRSF